MDPATGADVLLASGEALANAVEHAYAGRPPGTVEVEMSLASDRALELAVRDHGRWRPPSDEPGLTGRGLFLVRTVMDRVDIEHDGNGTRVSMRVRHRAAAADALEPPAALAPDGAAPASVTFAPGADGVHIGTVEGEIDASRISELGAAIERVAGSGADVALDLTAVSYIDSSGVRLLADVASDLAAAGARLLLRAAPDSPAGRITELCGLGATAGIVIEDGDSGLRPAG